MVGAGSEENQSKKSDKLMGKGGLVSFAGSATTMTVGGATLLHCGSGGDDRQAHLAIPPGALAPSMNAALGSTLNANGLGGLASLGPSAHTGATAGATGSAAAPWPPTLWQYPTAGEIMKIIL